MNKYIDVHSHFLPHKLLEHLEKNGSQYDSPVCHKENGQIFVVTPERPYGPIGPGFYDTDVRHQFLARNGICRQVLVAPPFVFYYWIDSKKAYEPIRIENDAIAEMCSSYPDTYSGLGTIPLQDVPLAIKECERIVQIGLRGVEIGSNINGVSLDSEQFFPFFEVAENLGLAILIHPNNVLGQEKMERYHLRNLIGFPSDTTLAAAKLIFGGVLERFPRLKICLGQAGGFLPYIIGRLDQGYQARPECRANISKPPSEYLRNFYFDSLIFEPAAFAMMVSRIGSDRIMMGTDFPFDMGATSPRAVLPAAPELSEEDQAEIAIKTATGFLGISEPPD